MKTGKAFDELYSLIFSHTLARCLHVLAEAGVADLLESEPRAVSDLAAGSGLDAGALERILRLLSNYGVFVAEGVGYMHTPQSLLLRSDHPQSLRAYARMAGMPVMWEGIARLPHAVRTGAPEKDWSQLVAHFAEHPDEASLFNESMTSKSLVAIDAMANVYDFGVFDTVADIGGGRGHLLQKICAGNATNGILFDLPHVIADVADISSAQLKLVGGDFFRDPLPAADAYTLMDILHDWNDEQAVEILSAVHRAAPPHARVLVIENMISERPEFHMGNLLDVMMLALTGGRERSRTDFQALFASAGLRLERVIETESQFSMVEASVV